MATATLNDVLLLAEKLKADEREMLIQILQKREIEEWRKGVAAAGRKAARELKAGKLKPMNAVEVKAHLEKLWDVPDE